MNQSSTAPIPPALVLVHDAAINHAFQHNAIPVVKDLRFLNDGTARKNLVIRVSTERLCLFVKKIFVFFNLTRIPRLHVGAFRKGFGIRALFFALDAPQGAPRQSSMCGCSKPLRNPPEANRGFRVEEKCTVPL
jgi:hypothetical protein